MYWYDIKKIKDGYVVIKNVESKNAIGSRRKFIGTMQQCIDYCKEHNIDLNKKYKIGD